MKILHQWFQSSLGQSVVESIQKQWELFDVEGLSRYTEYLQIGTSVPLLPGKKITVLSSEVISNADVVASMQSLPFENETFSMVFLPFTLEYTKDIPNLLNEVRRVLTRDGVLCIVGVNPFSLWGLAQLNGIKSHAYSSLRVYALLAARHFRIYGIKSFFYRPPFSSKKLLKKTRFLEPVGQMFWPYPGGLYFLLAQKVTQELLSVAPLWRTAGGYVFGKA